MKIYTRKHGRLAASRTIIPALFLTFAVLSGCGKTQAPPSAAAASMPVISASTPSKPPAATAAPANTAVPTKTPVTVTPSAAAAASPSPAIVTAPPETVKPAAGLDTSINTASPAFLRESADAGQGYIDNIIFLGDSTTYGLEYYGVLSGGKETKQVWTPASGTLTLSYQSVARIVYPEDGSEITIVDAVKRSKPSMMVITLGVNGVSFMDETSFKKEYSNLVRSIQTESPDTKIILQSLFPVASNYEYLASINNTKILDANRWVLSVAEDTGVKYLNTVSVLLGDDGWMIPAYGNGDGLHLGPEGFGHVLSYIRTHAYS